MAIKLSRSTATDTLKVVCRMDDAVQCDDEAFANYQKTLDETFLGVMSSEPTRFVLRVHLPYAAQKTVTSEQLSIGADGIPQIKLGFMLEDVRCSLIDIENPASVAEGAKILYTRDSDGFASKELIAQLHSAGIVTELFAARQAAVQRLLPPKK